MSDFWFTKATMNKLFPDYVCFEHFSAAHLAVTGIFIAIIICAMVIYKKLGEKAYEQCAGFLRIIDGKNAFDNTSVHPESYTAAEKLLKLCEKNCWYYLNVAECMRSPEGALKKEF